MLMVCRQNIMMQIHLRNAVVLFMCVGWLSLTSAYDFDSSKYASEDVITRDFCIIGGGSSGTYAAIRLRDMGKSVVVVERNDRLGGHTETYIDPVTHAPIDIGVLNWNNLDVVKSYLDRLNVSYTYTDNSSPGTITQYVDFSSGNVLPTFHPPDPTAALGAYAAQLANYPYLPYGFDLPSPVPDDLLLPFGDFVTKYSLQDLVFLIFTYAQGIGDLLSQLTLYVMKLVGLDLLQSFQTGFVVTTSHDNSEVYEAALGILGSDALLSTQVVATSRGDQNHDGYAKVVVRKASSSDGATQLIRAKRIIIAIPPKLENLAGFDLSEEECALFEQFGSAAYYTGVLLNTGIPANEFVMNVGNSSAYNLPGLPAPYIFLPSGVPGLTRVFYGSPFPLPDEDVQKDILATLLRVQQHDNATATGGVAPSFAVFAGHVPFEMTVPSKAIADGFYGRLYALQGQRQTYYTGAAFHTQDSALLWRFTEGLLPSFVG